MKSDDEKLRKVFDNFKNNLEIDNSMERRLMNMIEQKERLFRRRRILVGSVALAIAAFLVISSAVPVFGKNGTLPQVITGISLQKTASAFSGSIKTSPDTVKNLEDQNLSPTDNVIIAALAKQTNVSVDKIVQMREDGMGWGKILSTLGVSVNTVKSTLSEAAKSVTSTNAQQNDEKTSGNTEPNSENKNSENEGNEKGKQEENQENTNKVLIIKGTIESISGNAITVNGEAASVTDKTTIKYHGKALTVDKLSAGDEVLIKGKKSGDNIEAGSIIVIKMNNGNMQENNNKNEEKNQEEKEFELRSSIVSFDSGILKIEDFDNDIVVDENTKIQVSGSGRAADRSLLTADETVQIHIRKTDDKYYATSIVILKSDNKQNKDEQNKGQENANSQTVLTIKGTVKDISDGAITVNSESITITDKTSIKYHGKSITKDDINVGDEVLIKAVKSGEDIEANSVTVTKANNQNNSDKSTPKQEMFKGTVEAIDPDNGTITIAELKEVFKISPDTTIIYQGKAIKFDEISVGDSVNIFGTKQEDGSVTIDKIIITKKSSNPGNGNGKDNGNNKGKGKP